MDFQGKVAIVTGGAQGIGQAYCLLLLKKGVKVCMCDVKKPPTEFISNLPSEYKDNLIFQKCDVTSEKEFKDAFDTAIQKFGRIDIVVNNAGIMNEKEWKKVIEVNIVGVIHGIKLGYQYMGIDKGGSGGFIVNTSSTSGLAPYYPAPIYCCTKQAVIGLTRSYGSDYHFKKTGVKMGAVCPSGTATELFDTFPDLTVDAEEAKKLCIGMTVVHPDVVAEGLIKLLEDGKNGAVIQADADGIRYA